MSLLRKVLGLGRNEHYDEGLRLFDEARYEKALEAFERARDDLHKRPSTLLSRLTNFYIAETHTHLGQERMRQGQWATAADHFSKALAIHPNYADLHFQLAQAFRAMGNKQEALEALQKALTINPRYARAHLLMGLIRYEQGCHQEGLKAICQATLLEPAFHSEAYRNGIACHERGDTLAALQWFEQVHHTQIDDILFHFQLGDDLYRKALYQEAIAEYQKALTLNPDYADIRHHLGMAYKASGLYQEAMAEFRYALRLNPRFVDAHINLGLTLREVGQSQEAFTHFRKALDLEPDNPIAAENLKELAMVVKAA